MQRIFEKNAMLRRFAKEDGSITIWSLFGLILLLGFAGLALDVSNAVQARAQLQGAADEAGHAAIYFRQRGKDESDAIDKGIGLAEANMPTSAFGNVLTTTDVEFGDWDRVDRTFTVDPGNDTAVRVTTRRVESRTNELRTFLLHLVGLEQFELTAVSVWDAEDGFCPPRSPDKKRGEGFFAIGPVDMQTANNFYDGFCVHSDTNVKLSQNNMFEEGVVVSMPDKRDLVLPANGMDTNPGLPEALHSMDYNLEVFFDALPALVASYSNPASPVQPSYVTDTTSVYEVNLASGERLEMAMLQAGAVNKVTCADGAFDVKQAAVLKNVVIVTDCIVKFLKDSALENGTLVTSNTDIESINAPQGARFGATNYCQTGKNGANVLTLGGAKFAANFEGYGINMIADGYIKLAAKADGIGGVNIMSGDSIDVTADSDFGFCKYGPPQSFIIPTIRMVM